MYSNQCIPLVAMGPLYVYLVAPVDGHRFVPSLLLLQTSLARTCLAVQWLRLHTPNASGLGLTPGLGTRLHMPQLQPSAAKMNTYINKYFGKKQASQILI